MPSDRFDANAGFSVNNTTVIDAARNISAVGGTFTSNISAPNIVNSVNGLTGTVSALAGAFTYGMTAPASPTFGDRWFNSDDATYLVYVNDGNSNQWVEVGGGVGPQGATGTNVFSIHPIASTGGTANPLWSVPGIVTRGAATQSIFNGTQNYFPCIFSSNTTVRGAQVYVSTASNATADMRIGLYTANEYWQPVNLVSDFGTVAIGTTGTKTITGLSVAVTAGPHLLTCISSGAAGNPALSGLMGDPWTGTASRIQNTTPYGAVWRVSRTYAAFGATAPAWNTISDSNNNNPVLIFLQWG